MATLDEVIERAANTPNADVDCFAAAADFSQALVAVQVGVTRHMEPVDSGSGMSTPGVDGPVYLGIGQNAPVAGGASVVRVAGITKCIYGGVVAVGDRLTLDGATSRVVAFDAGQVGHTHSIESSIVRRVVTLTDVEGKGIPGADTSHFVATMEWDDHGSLLPASESVTFTEISDGRYYLAFTPLNPRAMYLLSVAHSDYAATGLVTPPDFQFDAPSYASFPVELSIALIVGRALVAGGDGDVGLMLIQPQMF